ncbi:Opi1-domain-containing protein [Amylocystis lapponica]|nr:Opi1-domain-containing protein [Amylocystis lapponica]
MPLDEDESVRIAVRALGDMRNNTRTSPTTSFQPTPALSITSGTSSPSLPSPTMNSEDRMTDSERAERRLSDDDFVSRMSNLPLVNTALRAYEHGKASSRVVKYGAEMMESSVKSISRPVMDRLPVGQLDEFACRQLDRLENYTRRASSRDRSDDRSRERSVSRDRARSTQWDLDNVSISRSDHRSRRERWEEGSTSVQAQSRTPTPHSQYLSSHSYSRSPAPHSHSHSTSYPSQQPPLSASSASGSESQQVAQRSRWQVMLTEAGGLGAAVSEESMRRLRYCLQWLQYATAHIDAQILVLRNFITSLQSTTSDPHSVTAISAHHLHTLNAAKRDVVDTLRQVVDVVSRYAGGALPEPACRRVRSFILHLPRRWAQASGVDSTTGSSASSPVASGASTALDGSVGGGADRAERRGNAAAAPYSYGPGESGPSARSRPSSRATSPMASRAHSRQTSGSASGRAAGTAPPTPDSASQAAQRILTLATESLDMLRGVTAVFRESLDRADTWVERLRVVGLQRQQNSDGADEDNMLDFREPLPPLNLPPFPAHSSFHTHRGDSPTASRSQLSPSPFAPSPLASGHATPYSHSHLSRSSSTSSFGHPTSYFHPDLRSPAAALDALSLSASANGSRYTTPKSVLAGLPPEGDGGGGGGRGEKRSLDRDGDDAAAVAAAALAGLAGSGPAKRARQEKAVDVGGMAVDR